MAGNSSCAHAFERLIYVSTFVGEPVAVQAILATARARNARTGLTGALLFTGCRFSQVLEGRPEDVQRAWSSILRDRRHKDVKLLWREPVNTRAFASWSMGFLHLAGADQLLQSIAAVPPESEEQANLVFQLLFRSNVQQLS